MSTGTFSGHAAALSPRGACQLPSNVSPIFSPNSESAPLPAPLRDDHSMMGEPADGTRERSWEVYAAMSGIDSLFSGLSKRTPTGGFFTS